MVIENLGIKTDQFYLPPFELKEGEIILIKLANDNLVSEIENSLKELLSGKKNNSKIILFKKILVVENIIESFFQYHFYPLTVGNYIKRNANSKSSIPQRIYEIEWINSKTKLRKLPGNPRKLLSLYTTLSKNNNIIFDMFGQDQQGRRETFNIVKKNIEKSGCAILIDCFDSLENESAKCIEVAY